jgi:hypothetical protein
MSANLKGIYDGGYYKTAFLEDVEKEIQSKAFRVKAGVDTFSKAETLAYLILKKIGYFAD